MAYNQNQSAPRRPFAGPGKAGGGAAPRQSTTAAAGTSTGKGEKVVDSVAKIEMNMIYYRDGADGSKEKVRVAPFFKNDKGQLCVRLREDVHLPAGTKIFLFPADWSDEKAAQTQHATKS